MASKNVPDGKTLADKVETNFSDVKLKKAVVNVPKLKKAKKAAKPFFLPKAKDGKMPISSIVELLIKSAVDGAKKESTEKKPLPAFLSEKSYTVLKEDEGKNAGGYGTISKAYGAALGASYVNYEKLFSHIGNFRSQSAYENIGGNNSGGSSDSGKFSLIDTETIDKGAKFVRYFSNPGLDMYSASLSLVPLGGMNAGEWEQFKLFMQIDKVMYRFKTSTS